MHVMWLFYTCITRKLHVRKKLHELLRTLQLHASCVYLDGSSNLFLFVHAQCVYFSQSKDAYRVYGATKSNLKLSELKLPFGVFNNRYTCSFHNKFHFIAAGTGIIHVTLCLQFEVQDSVFESHVSFTEVDKIKSRTFFPWLPEDAIVSRPLCFPVHANFDTGMQFFKTTYVPVEMNFS